MKNNKGFALITIVLVVVAVLVVGGTAYFAGKSSNTSSQNVVDKKEGENNVATSTVQNNQSNCIVVNSPKLNEKVGKIINVTGYVKGCDNWTATIGVAGEMYIKDENGNILNNPNDPADGNLNVNNWDQKYPANFLGQIVIVKQPETKFGILTINNENQSENTSIDRKIEIKLDLSNIKILSNENTVACATNDEFCFGTQAYESRIRQETNHTCNISKDPVVVIISPKEGQIFNASEPVIIKWATCNSIENVFISLADGGRDKGLISEKPVKSSLGSYQWTAPRVPSLNYKISITSSVAPYTNKIVNFKVK